MTSVTATPTPAANASDEQHFTPIRDAGWRAHWIAAEPSKTQAKAITIGSSDGDKKFGRFLFRTTFDLETIPETIPARITADSRYVLYVNGHEAGRGPVRSQPRRMRYDDYDLAPFAQAGLNVLVVLVTYYGRANSFWQPAQANPTLGVDGLLALEANLGDRWLVTDSGWDAQRTTAWSDTPGGKLDGLPVECLDGRLLDPSWRSSLEPGSGWHSASIIQASHPGSLARTQPPADPYGPLLPRPIGALEGDTVSPVSLASSEGLSPAAEQEHPVLRVKAFLADTDGAPCSDTALPLSWEAEAQETRHLVIDMGRIVCGHVRFSLSAPAGTRVDLMYREKPYDPYVVEAISAPNTGARYIARGHSDIFEAQDVNGFRYAHILISADAGSQVTLGGFEVAEFLYPLRGEAFFRSNDEELNALYDAGRRTVTLNSHDSFVDCPTREQRAWVGDGVVHQMVSLVTSTDWRLAWWYLDLGNSPRSDGILPMSVVGEIEHSGGFTIPDWSLNWIHGVYNLYRHTGDKAKLSELMPTVERILRWYVPYVTDEGLLADVPEWNLVDWSSVLVSGTSSILTSLWARGLREYADMSRYLGNAGSAQWALDHWAAAASGFELFWDESRGAYIDHVVDGKHGKAASQIAGAAAIVSGLAPGERWSRIISRITDPARLVVRSWIGGDGGYDEQKMLDQMRGIQNIDWDENEQVVIAEPFLSYLVHDAIADAGQAAMLPSMLKRWSQFLHDGYDTFGECWGWGTPVHGWSSTPTRDIVIYLLGVEPSEPGYHSARIAPAFGAARNMTGAVPTPYGLIKVDIDGNSVTVESPIPFTLVGPDGTEHAFAAGAASLR